MADPTTAPSPDGVTIIGESAPKAPPAPTTSVSVSAMPTSADLTAPKKGTVRDEIRQALRKRVGQEPEPSAGETKPGPSETKPPAGETKPTGGETKPSAGETLAEAGKKAKANPWKLYESEKQARAQVEQQFQEYRSKVPKDVDVAALSDRATRAEKLSNDLANEIRYHAYEKSPEFQKDFHAPYEAAFRRALDDLKEVPVTDPNTNQTRALTGDDLAQVAFMSLAQAKEVAKRLFPDFADDVLSARKEIRSLWDKRQSALNEWKDKGGERAKQATEQFQRQRAELSKEVQTNWSKANEELLAHETRGEYFKDREGDQEWNDRLKKGYDLADAAFATNLLDPNLKPEDRAAAVKRYAAIRARAASWGPLRHQNETLRSRVAELEAKLKEYTDTTPAAGGKQTSTTTGAPLTANQSWREALRKRAVPA